MLPPTVSGTATNIPNQEIVIFKRASIVTFIGLFTTQESPLTPEANPLVDIPDNQAFVNYASSSGNYSLDVPEGRAQTTNGSDARFVDNFDGLSVSITQTSSAPTADSVRQKEIATLTAAGRAF